MNQSNFRFEQVTEALAAMAIPAQQRDLSRLTLKEIQEDAVIESASFAGIKEPNVIIRGVTFNNCSFTDLDCPGMRFEGCTFNNCTFQQASFVQGGFSGGSINGSTLVDVDLTEGELEGLKINRSVCALMLTDSRIENLEATETVFSSSRSERLSISNSNFQEGSLYLALAHEATFSVVHGINQGLIIVGEAAQESFAPIYQPASHMSLSHVDWDCLSTSASRHRQYIYTDIFDSTIENCSFKGIGISASGFTGSNINNSSFSDCDFPSADFTDSTFTNCRFVRCAGGNAHLNGVHIIDSTTDKAPFKTSSIRASSLRESEIPAVFISAPNQAQEEGEQRYQARRNELLGSSTHSYTLEDAFIVLGIQPSLEIYGFDDAAHTLDGSLRNLQEILGTTLLPRISRMDRPELFHNHMNPYMSVLALDQRAPTNISNESRALGAALERIEALGNTNPEKTEQLYALSLQVLESQEAPELAAVYTRIRTKNPDDWTTRLPIEVTDHLRNQIADSERSLVSEQILKAAGGHELALAEARRSYRNLARKMHPDVGGDESSFKAINAANELLEVIFGDMYRRARIEMDGTISVPTAAAATDFEKSLARPIHQLGFKE